jgi:DNA-binding transcriptional LysR family regulator
MEVHQLRYFCAIVQQGTFTRAAESEHVSQPSLSQQIHKLEDELGGKLFHRLPRSARLTPLGLSFLPRALAILREIRDSKAEARKIIDLRRSQTGPESGSGPANQLQRIDDTQRSAKEDLPELPNTA